MKPSKHSPSIGFGGFGGFGGYGGMGVWGVWGVWGVFLPPLYIYFLVKNKSYYISSG